MRFFLLIISFLLSSVVVNAAPLLPGARVLITHSNKLNKPGIFPAIAGKIINISHQHSLTATSFIKVPNQFPDTISKNSAINYSVSPSAPVGGYEQWTNPIKYVYPDGSGCYIQFAWDPVAKSSAIALTGVTPKSFMQCSSMWVDPNDGTNIKICEENQDC
jgi:hypothetical protein